MKNKYLIGIDQRFKGDQIVIRRADGKDITLFECDKLKRIIDEHKEPYEREFPDFKLDVEIPKGFEDDSWHKDAHPSWLHGIKRLKLWITDQEDSKKFIVDRFNVNGDLIEYPSFMTDSYEELINWLDKQ